MSNEYVYPMPSFEVMHHRLQHVRDTMHVRTELGRERLLDKVERARIARVLARLATLDEKYWRDYALCQDADVNLFFPEDSRSKAGRESIAKAKKICEACPAIEYCARIADTEHGVWAGKTIEQRKEAIRREHRRRRLKG